MVDHSRPIQRLDSRPGKRARFALKVERTRDLPPLLGEFLIAQERDGAGSLEAALWTSPLGPEEAAGMQKLLRTQRG